jgi:hypothetical protein
MHTDESWLAGLSRAMIQDGNAAATEPFFNIVQRFPHAVKIFFHALQIPFIVLFKYNLFSIRLLSLLTGSAALAVFGNLLKKLCINPLFGTILLSLQIQFIYASHFGRQEIQILLLMLLSVDALYSNHSGFRRGLLAGLPVALALGFHPNAFIAAWPSGLILLFDLFRKKRSIRESLGYLILPALASVFFILLSLLFNSSFVSSYISFGQEVGTMDSFDIKLLGFDDFYQKLFLRVSGTYYTPRIWPIFVIAVISGLWLIISRKKQISSSGAAALTAVITFIGINTGILILGKYSAPSIVLVIPALVLLVSAGINQLPTVPVRRLAGAAALAVVLVNSLMMLTEDNGPGHESYADYQKKITAAIPEGSSRILGSLTTEFFFDNGRLLDWRNLSMLRSAGMSLEDYIRESSIEYIIYNEEYDLIYRQRPVWNILYGNPVIYYEQMQQFLSENCILISEFKSPGYGTRIVMHRYKKDWMVRIYQVDKT